MDYSQAFRPKSSSLFVVLLFLAGRCYEAEVCVILLTFRYSFIWCPFFAEVKIFRFWPKTMVSIFAEVQIVAKNHGL